MLQTLREINPSFKAIYKSPIKVGPNHWAWHATAINYLDEAVAGGFATDENLAYQIAVSEFVERSMYFKFRKDPVAQKLWKLDELPTCCGFAVGFNRQSTIGRSLLEALERWTLSQWVDGQLAMDPVLNPILSLSAKFLLRQFSQVCFLKKSVPFWLNDRFIVGQVGCVVGFVGSGAFAGFSSSFNELHLWEHALVEAFRHLLIYKNGLETNQFPANRIFYFARHGAQVKKFLQRPCRKDWPLPKISFFKETRIKNFYLARTIFKGWQSWHLGPVDRFLY